MYVDTLINGNVSYCVPSTTWVGTYVLCIVLTADLGLFDGNSRNRPENTVPCVLSDVRIPISISAEGKVHTLLWAIYTCTTPKLRSRQVELTFRGG